VKSIDLKLPASRLQNACEHLDTCRLPRPVWPQVADELSFTNVKGDGVDSRKVLITPVEEINKSSSNTLPTFEGFEDFGKIFDDDCLTHGGGFIAWKRVIG